MAGGQVPSRIAPEGVGGKLCPRGPRTNVLDESDGAVTFEGATLNGEEQVPALAHPILERMCQDSRG